MNTRTIMKMGFALGPEDLSRLGLEVTKDDDGKLYFTATYLSTKVNARETYKDFRQLFEQIFQKPATIFYHSEDQIEQTLADDKTERTVKIVEMAIRPDAIG
jgi:hypothetical protein